MFSWPQRPAAYPARRASNNRTQTTQQTPKGYTRKQHIESYLNDPVLKASSRQVSAADDKFYDTVFQTSVGHVLIIRIYIPPEHLPSSSSAPGMTLVGVSASHPWIDTRMRITGYGPIQSDSQWQSANILLGAAVNDVVKHLQLNPPQVIEIKDSTLQRMQKRAEDQPAPQQTTAASASPSSNDAPPDYQSVLSGLPARDIELPSVPSSFPELETMTRSELQQLFDKSSTFEEYAKNQPVAKTVGDLKSDIVEGNVKMAKENLAKEDGLTSLYASVSSLRQSLKTKIDTFNSLEKRYSQVFAPPKKQDVIRDLTKAKREAMTKSDSIADDFVSGSVELEEFLKNFMEHRKIHHVRAAKAERLKYTN